MCGGRSAGRRWVALAAAVAMQLCLGATYSWAVFVGPLRRLEGIGQAAAQLPYSLFYYVFPLTLTALASAPGRHRPVPKAVGGGLLFGTAWIVAGHCGGRPVWLTAAIGVLGGVGVGLAYLVPVATAMAWFPRHKGLVTGVAVAGFGGGAALLGRLADHLMAVRGWSPYEVLRAFGMAFIVVVPLAGLAMAEPPRPVSAGAVPAPMPPRLRTIAASPAFRVLLATFTAGLAAGLSINGNLRQLGAAAAAGTGLVPAFAIANAAGRLAWGWAADRLPPAATLTGNLAAWTGLLLAARWLDRTPAGLLALAATGGFLYGGALVVHPSAVARIWGADAFVRVYGWLAAAHFLAALGPAASGWTYDSLGTFRPAFLAGAFLCAAAGGLAWRRRDRMSAA